MAATITYEGVQQIGVTITAVHSELSNYSFSGVASGTDKNITKISGSISKDGLTIGSYELFGTIHNFVGIDNLDEVDELVKLAKGIKEALDLDPVPAKNGTTTSTDGKTTVTYVSIDSVTFNVTSTETIGGTEYKFKGTVSVLNQTTFDSIIGEIIENTVTIGFFNMFSGNNFNYTNFISNSKVATVSTLMDNTMTTFDKTHTTS